MACFRVACDDGASCLNRVDQGAPSSSPPLTAATVGVVTKRDLALIAETRAALADGTARARRVTARIRLSEMAAACEVSPAMVSMIERDLRVPGTQLALGYGRALAAAERRKAA